MKYFDSHAHLQDERIYHKVPEIIERALQKGVQNIVCCGSTEDDWDVVSQLSKQYSEIIPAYGLHPWYIKSRTQNWANKLEKLLSNKSAIVGEIGLDHFIENYNEQDQNEILKDHILIAKKHNRPFSLHCRKAWGTMIPLLKGLSPFPSGGAIHSYSGPKDFINLLQKMNISISFSGSITYERNKRGRECAGLVSDEYLLIETDSPDILPANYPYGTLNEPSYIESVVNSLATIRNVNSEYIAEKTFANGMKLFCM